MNIVRLLLLEQNLCERHTTYKIQNLKVIGEWALSLINAQVSTFPTNVGLIPTLLTLATFLTLPLKCESTILPLK